MAHFLTGVNYWPRSSAMAMWSRFDLGEIDEDLARMQELGLEVVRFFLMWEAFQPEPFATDATQMTNLGNLLERMSARNLRAIPTLFCGHMSGVNWLPAWTLEPGAQSPRFRTIAHGSFEARGIGDFYTGELLEAQRFFAREIGTRFREHPAILVWDLGNEFSNLRAPRTQAEADHWCAALAYDLFESSNLGATAGIHGEDLTQDRNIRPSSLCDPLRFASMHGYPAYSEFARSPADPEVVPFLCELTSSFSEKAVFFTEFGTPVCAAGSTGQESATAIPCLDEDAGAEYARAALVRLQRRGALGALWWCWTDYPGALAATPPFDRAPHELHFGLLRADGTERPVAGVLKEFGTKREPLQAVRPPFANEASYYAGLPDSTTRAYAAYLWDRSDESEFL